MLAALQSVATTAGWRCVLIGGSVPEVIVSRGGDAVRPTFDADVVVSTATWDEFKTLRQMLEALGFRRGAEHQLFSPEGAELDLVPFGDGVVTGQELRWPDGTRMSALGLAEALETARPERIDEQLEFDVVPEATFVLLKLIAYQDRSHDRQRDVADVIATCERYEFNSDRRYEAAGQLVDDVAVTFDDAGGLVLGWDVASIAHPDSLQAARRFFEQITDSRATAVRHALAQEKRIFDEARRDRVFRLLRVLHAGLRR